jgi:zinc protease
MARNAADRVTKKKLANGLTVVLKEMRTTPVTAFCVWYRVGSRDEHVGITGASHWVEHMMFKGTRRYSETEMDRLVSRDGGMRNAFTWLDFTAYYETMPSDKIDLAIDIESDRMVNARFDPKELESERTVIINEREMYENGPGFRLAEEIQSAAYRVHPYGHEVIGHAADLRTMTRADLFGHYKRYYAPDNAVVAVAGDFDAKDMLAKVQRAFGKFKPARAPRRRAVAEPQQRGQRRVRVNGEGDTHYLTLAFHAPAALDPDYMPLVALDSVLCGASGLALFGGGTSNRSSRLSRALVDKGWMADIGGGVVPTIDPYLYSIGGTVLPGKRIEDVERRVWAEIERIRTAPVNRAELDRAIKQTRAQVAFNTETVTNQAFWLGFSEIVANNAWFNAFLERLSSVTIDDVQRVAKKYLSPDNATVGHYIAQGMAG